MRLTIGALALSTLFAASPAFAAGLCNCCGDATAAACATVCAPVKVEPGQCVVTVDFAAEAEIGPGRNPLYDIPMRSVWIDKPDAGRLEAFRRLLERARRGAESDRAAALRDHKRGKIGAEEAARLAKRYDDAMVNYFLAMQAYRLHKS